MAINAMNLLYISRYDGFCSVSSDSDFNLASRSFPRLGTRSVRSWEQKTPNPFVTACDKSIYTEKLVHLDELVPCAGSIQASGIWSPAKKDQNDGHLANRLRPS